VIFSLVWIEKVTDTIGLSSFSRGEDITSKA